MKLQRLSVAPFQAEAFAGSRHHWVPLGSMRERMALREFSSDVHVWAMGKSAIFLCVTAAAFASLWGWGWLTLRCTRSRPLTAPLTATVGLGTMIFLGGVLLVGRLAVGPALDLVVLAGLLLAAVGWFKRMPRLPQFGLKQAAACVLPLAAGWYLAHYLTPLAGFNYHDDFERYFVYPVRMLATGTFAPNPLGYLGADTLGAEAFLQAFVAAHFPIEYIGSVDLAGGLLLCLVLAGSGVSTARSLVAALVAESLLLAINPELVNISPVFTGAALIMAVILLAGAPSVPERSGAQPILTGLLYAGMIALKTTFVVFVAAHLLVTAAATFSPLRERFRSCLMTGLWTVVALAPWIILHSPLYLAAAKPGSSMPEIANVREALGLFSSIRLPGGASQLHYTGLGLLGLLVAAGCAVIAAKKPALRAAPMESAIAGGLAAGLTYLILVAALGPLMYGRDTATRYAIPVLLGALPAVLRMFDSVDVRRRWLPVLPVAGGLLMTVLFAPSFVYRIKEMAGNRIPWSYFFDYSGGGRAEFLAYSDSVLHGPVRDQLAKLQAQVPSHETIAVWVAAPFWLDFSRNTIWHTDPYGISMPWARWPEEATYFLVQHNGPAVRSGEDYKRMETAVGAADRIVGFRADAFLQQFVEHSGRESIAYADDTYALVRLRAP